MQAVELPEYPVSDLECCSLYEHSRREANEYRWIESEKAGHDLGEPALHLWVTKHWWGFLRARWVEHLYGTRFWIELDRDDFGLLRKQFPCDPYLLDRIVDHLKAGKENLDIIRWAEEWHLPTDAVIEILEKLDINGHRLLDGFDVL